MKKIRVIPEIEVLIASALWLKKRGVFPLQFSVARGQGIDSEADKDQLQTTLLDAGVPVSLIRMVPDGPDLVAISKSEYWQIECKGAGIGKQSTQRNNFDRALASVVSYYCDATPEMPPDLKELQGASSYLGLALPNTQSYIRELRKRVGRALRQRLNLWVLIFDPSSKTIQSVLPDEDI